MQNTWQQNIRNNLTSAKQCNQYFETNIFKEKKFSIKIPLDFVKLIKKNDLKDPLLQQVLATTDTNVNLNGFLEEPLNDSKYTVVSGLIHKYHNRALLITSQSCAIHCHYCFRQNFPYFGNDAFKNWHLIKQYLQNNQQINEIILSGGDPLNLSNEKLKNLMTKITQIKTIKTIRIHSRTLSIIRNRITKDFVNIINNHPLRIVLVTHINHPNEITTEFIRDLAQLNCQILNQSVLLKGVNDNEEVLITLSNKLWDGKILPYYLHLLDQVSGSERFFVKDDRVQEIYQNIQQKLSGYLLPRLVYDNDKLAKTILNP